MFSSRRLFSGFITPEIKRREEGFEMDYRHLMDATLEKKVLELLELGKRVEAVTAVQKTIGIGLKNSKDLVDEMHQNLRKLKLNPV